MADKAEGEIMSHLRSIIKISVKGLIERNVEVSIDGAALNIGTLTFDLPAVELNTDPLRSQLDDNGFSEMESDLLIDQLHQTANMMTLSKILTKARH